MKTINVSPTWEGVLPLLVALLTNATEKGQQTAREELLKMAKAADLYNASIDKSKGA